MEDVVRARHRGADALEAAHVADVEPDLARDVRELRLVLVPHVVLLLLVARKYADLSDVRPEEAPQDRVPEAAGPAGNHQGFSGQ